MQVRTYLLCKGLILLKPVTINDAYSGLSNVILSSFPPLIFLEVFRTVRCVEINTESKNCFEKTVSRLPKLVDSNMSWHQADASLVSFDHSSFYIYLSTYGISWNACLLAGRRFINIIHGLEVTKFESAAYMIYVQWTFLVLEKASIMLHVLKFVCTMIEHRKHQQALINI